MQTRSYNTFLKDPDQEARRAEVAAFVGPNAAKFLKIYDRQVADATRPSEDKARFSLLRMDYVWPAFFLGPVWFFYRKLWVWGAGITVVVGVIGFFVPVNGAGIGLSVGMAGGASWLYLSHAVKRIEALRASKAPGEPMDMAELAAVGGVSRTAGYVAGAIYLLLVVFAVYSIVATGGNALR